MVASPEARLSSARRRLAPSPASARAEIAVHGKHLRLRVLAEPSEAPIEKGWIEILIAPNLIITLHDGHAPFLDRLDERIKSDATVGKLTAASFLRSLLDAIVTTYYEAVDRIEDEVDDLDTRSPLARPDEDILPELVDVRRKIARLRRLLSDHREVDAALADADASEIADPDDEGFAAVAQRLEGAIHSVEDSRDLLLGSFDVFMSRVSQRTNDAMKVLALATALLLPGSLIAGLLGMNVVVPLSKDDPSSFWIVVGGISWSSPCSCSSSHGGAIGSVCLVQLLLLVLRRHRAARVETSASIRDNRRMTNTPDPLFVRDWSNPILTAGSPTRPTPSSIPVPPGSTARSSCWCVSRTCAGSRRCRRTQSPMGWADGRSTPSRSSPASRPPEEIWGCEDPSLTWLDGGTEWAIAYTAYSQRGRWSPWPRPRDFRTVRRLGPVMPPEDKDAALFPRRFGVGGR